MAYLKSVRFLMLLFLVVTIVIGCIALILVGRLNAQWRAFSEDAIATDSDELNALQESEHSEDIWIMKSYGEQIGIYKLNGELECVLDVYLITLPDADRELLENGIYVSGRDSLNALVEDYTG